MKYSYDNYYKMGYDSGYRDAKNNTDDCESAMVANIGQKLCDGYKDDAESDFYDGYSDAQDEYLADSSL